MSGEVLRIANCSGFFGDRLSAAREMVDGGPIDVLTGDYLAELTMAILWRQRAKDPTAGYVPTFLAQMEEVLGACIERGIRVVSNAGGLNPHGLAAELRALAKRSGLEVSIAVVEGDDLMDRLPELRHSGHPFTQLDTGESLAGRDIHPVTANAYLGCWGIAEALRAGADLVITGRTTDAALVMGPAAWKFGWEHNDWDALAGALVAGHIIECGAQCTGGNYAFFRDVPGLGHVGFPVAELRADGSAVITKHPGTGGLVSVGTVTAQLLYEIGGPRYLSPDVTARFDTIELGWQGPDRVLVSGVRGEPPPESAKVAFNYLGGYRNSVTFVLTGLDIDEKAALAEEALWQAVGGRGQFAETDVQLLRADRPDPPSNEAGFAYLRITVKDRDEAKVGRAFSGRAVEMALAHYPGLTLTGPPGNATPFAVYWPALLPAAEIKQKVVLDDREIDLEPLRASTEGPPIEPPVRVPLAAPAGPTIRIPLGRVFGARSGDKGGNANVGIWAQTQEAYAWLRSFLTIERFADLIPEAASSTVERHEFPNLLALNFVVIGLLGEGAAASVRADPQGKTLGEYVRARMVDLPEALLR